MEGGDNGGRSKRAAAAGRGAKVKGVLASLAELRKGGGRKQLDDYEYEGEEDVYDMVDDAEYAEIVRKRREEGGGFVIDEEGLGYADVGEEEDWGAPAAEAGPEAGGSAQKKGAGSKKGAAGGKRKAAAEPVPGARARMQRMMAAAAVKAKPKAAAVDDASADALLDDILGGLGNAAPGCGAGSGGAAAVPRARPAAPAPAAMRAGRLSTTPKAVTFQQSSIARPAAAATRSATAARPAAAAAAAGPEGLADSATPVAAAAPPEEEQYLGDDDGYAGPEDDDAMDVEEQPAEAAATDAAPPADERSPAPSAPGAAAASRTPWKTPAPLFPESKTPVTAAPASGWQAILDEEGVCGEQGGQAAAEEAAGVDADAGTGGATTPGSAEAVHAGEGLAVDSEGGLPFYLLDAHEEAAQPGVVYLFGKVPQGAKHTSCCAVVRGLMRNIFVVPREEVGSPEIDVLEEAAAADPGAKKQLLAALHQAFAPVKAEVRALLGSHHVTQISIKPVKREYAFENPEVHPGRQWVLKVKYPGTQPALPHGLTGETFSALFGAGQSLLEALMLKRRLMGPGWLSIKSAATVAAHSQVSWCALEVEVSSHKHISSSADSRDAPPLTVAALHVKTVMPPGTQANEIVAASVVYLTNVATDRPMAQEEWNSASHLRHFSAVRRLDNAPFPSGFDAEVRRANASDMGRRNGGAMLSMQANERALLTMLVARLRQIDADVFVGHNFAAFDLDVLLHRLAHHKVPNWSSLGRLKRSRFPNLSGGGHSFGGGAGPGALSAVAGRLLCDTYLAARDLVREVDYTLSTLARSLLKQERSELSAADVPGKFESVAKLLSLVRHAESDAWLAMGLAFYLSVLPLTRQLASLSGCLWSKVLLGQRAQRIEMLLLHEFYDKKFLLPDKLSAKDKARMEKARGGAEDGEEQGGAGGAGGGGSKKAKGPQYAGGLVLEPKKGLYDRFVLLLDFNSLYPSIIQEYNICFTTVARPQDGSIPPLPEPSEQMAVLPRVIRTLVQRRRTVKDLLKTERDPVRRQQLEIRQQALKLTANSMYGCLGFGNSRFYAKPLAELITSQGREILQSTVDLVQGTVGREVIYGDTDSIMVYTGSDSLPDVVKLGQAIKKEVNKRYKLLEIEMDGVFKCMLLLKKKKYAAVKVEAAPDGSIVEVMEQKGLDIVRRDWCPLSKDAGNFALREILSGRPQEDVVAAIHQHLGEVKEQVLGGGVPLNKFVITKQLTKRPEDYPDAKNQPHVQVALRRKAAGKQNGVMAGETVPYIICVERNEEGQVIPRDTGLADRAYHPEEVASTPGLGVDVEYYLGQQVFPVVSRLCSPIDGTDAARLAECLGLDPSRYRHHVAAPGAGAGSREEVELAAAASLDDEERYKHCDPLVLLPCAGGQQLKFGGVAEVARVAAAADTDAAASSSAEVAALAKLTPAQVANQLRLAVRRHISAYYDGRMRSDDELIPCHTRNVCLRSAAEAATGSMAPPDLRCSGQVHQAYTAAQLYTQLSHYLRLTDVSAAVAAAAQHSKEAGEAVEAALAPAREALEVAADTARQLRDASAYGWVQLASFF